ncbi:MAG: Flp pilus assembly protein CpaB [Eubacterium sp.]|nr:Flp pilus assembly protein CpaB [Eubacterium sp.]
MKKVYLIAVVFALIAAIATYLFATQLDKKTTIKDADTVPVVVALKDIPQNTIITADMLTKDAGNFEVKQIPTDFAVPDPVSKLEDLTDRVICVEVKAKDQIGERSYVSEDSDKIGLSFKLADGHQAYALRASDVNGVDGYISPGDTVDIITYTTGEDGKVKGKTAYKNLKVLRVSNNTENTAARSSDSAITAYSTITVDVTKEQALKLIEVENGTDYKLVLNSRKADQKSLTTTTQAASEEA